MKSLAELEAIKSFATKQEGQGITLKTQQHGLTVGIGKMSTQSSLQNQTSQSSLVSTNGQKKPLALRDDSESRSKLSKLLLISFDVLDTFGKEAEQLENINLAFQMYLEEYSYNQIEGAFKQYMKTNSVMPKPSDIISLIESPVAKKTMLTPEQEAVRKKLREKYGSV